MKKEARFSSYLRDNLKPPDCKYQRIETGLTVLGFPDTILATKSGFSLMELKAIYRWPKRGTTVIDLDSSWPLQFQYIKEMNHIAGRCWLFLKVVEDREYFLVHFDDIHTDRLTKYDFRLITHRHYSKRIDFDEFTQTIDQTARASFANSERDREIYYDSLTRSKSDFC